jgi:predicted ABC-type ATPase
VWRLENRPTSTELLPELSHTRSRLRRYPSPTRTPEARIARDDEVDLYMDLRRRVTEYQVTWWMEDAGVARRCEQVAGFRAELELAARAGLVDTTDVYEDDAGSWDPVRAQLHASIVRVLMPSEHRTRGAPRRAYVLSGAPGAGKTSVLTRLVYAHRRYAGTSGEPLVVISADDLKPLLNEYRNGLGSVVVHLEACHIVYELLYPAVLASDADIVIDSIGRVHDVRRFVEELASRGYEVHLLAVLCQPDDAVGRMRARAVDTHRLVPSDVVRRACEEAARTVETAQQEMWPLGSWLLVDNSGPIGEAPIIETGTSPWGTPHGEVALW